MSDETRGRGRVEDSDSVSGKRVLASCEGASAQVGGERMGELRGERRDELVVWHTSREPGRRNQGGMKSPVASWRIESRYEWRAIGREYQGGQRPRGMMSPGRMVERRRIGCRQDGHRGT